MLSLQINVRSIHQYIYIIVYTIVSAEVNKLYNVNLLKIITYTTFTVLKPIHSQWPNFKLVTNKHSNPNEELPGSYVDNKPQ